MQSAIGAGIGRAYHVVCVCLCVLTPCFRQRSCTCTLEYDGVALTCMCQSKSSALQFYSQESEEDGTARLEALIRQRGLPSTGPVAARSTSASDNVHSDTTPLTKPVKVPTADYGTIGSAGSCEAMCAAGGSDGVTTSSIAKNYTICYANCRLSLCGGAAITAADAVEQSKRHIMSLRRQRDGVATPNAGGDEVDFGSLTSQLDVLQARLLDAQAAYRDAAACELYWHRLLNSYGDAVSDASQRAAASAASLDKSRAWESSVLPKLETAAMRSKLSSLDDTLDALMQRWRDSMGRGFSHTDFLGSRAGNLTGHRSGGVDGGLPNLLGGGGVDVEADAAALSVLVDAGNKRGRLREELSSASPKASLSPSSPSRQRVLQLRAALSEVSPRAASIRALRAKLNVLQSHRRLDHAGDAKRMSALEAEASSTASALAWLMSWHDVEPGAACASSHHCGLGMVCNSRKMACVSLPRRSHCNATSWCGNGDSCIRGVCTPVPYGLPCGLHSDCGVGQSCVSGRCVLMKCWLCA